MSLNVNSMSVIFLCFNLYIHVFMNSYANEFPFRPITPINLLNYITVTMIVSARN